MVAQSLTGTLQLSELARRASRQFTRLLGADTSVFSDMTRRIRSPRLWPVTAARRPSCWVPSLGDRSSSPAHLHHRHRPSGGRGRYRCRLDGRRWRLVYRSLLLLALSDERRVRRRTARWSRLAALSPKCPVPFACVTTYSSMRRSRSALAMTDTELKVIAALATIGDSRIWKTGYSTPAARGTPSASSPGSDVAPGRSAGSAEATASRRPSRHPCPPTRAPSRVSTAPARPLRGAARHTPTAEHTTGSQSWEWVGRPSWVCSPIRWCRSPPWPWGSTWTVALPRCGRWWSSW